jgi:molecular chaperone HscA
MAGQGGGYVLGVDLGTSNTVAVVRWPDGRTRPLLFDGLPIMPSGVFLDSSGRLHVGRDAQRLAQSEPARYEPNPKRRIDETVVLLGDREVSVVDLLAAVLRAVSAAAIEAVGFLPPAVLTYPVSWGARRRQVLAAALARAGWPPIDPVDMGQYGGSAAAPRPAAPGLTRLVAEPVAAARYFSEVLRRPIPVGSAIAVFDFGGGTLDIAVVRNEGPDQSGRARFAVIGSGGVAELGGLDLDAALVEHLGRVVGPGNEEAWRQLMQPATVTQWRNRRQFWDDVRGAKEMLSRASAAPVAVPGVEHAVHLTRDELERVVAPLLRRGVAETAAVIESCRLAPDQLSGLFLVGGSSRVPLVARLLHAELGIAPTVLEQPELPVAEGAIAEFVAPRALAGTVPTHAMGASPAVPVSGPPHQAAPGLPVSGVPVSTLAAPVSALPHQASATAVAPISPVPSQAASPSPHATTYGAPPAHGGVTSPAQAAAGGPRWRRVLRNGAAAAVALAVVAVGIVYFSRGSDKLTFYDSFVDVGEIEMKEKSPSNVYTTVAGDRAYLGHVREDDRFELIAADLNTGKELWRRQTSVAFEYWRGLRPVPNGVLVLAEVLDADAPRKMVMFDESGKELWNQDFLGRDSLYYFDTTIVKVESHEKRVVGIDLRSGARRWELPWLTDEDGNSASTFLPVSTSDDLAGPASVSGRPWSPNHGDDQRIIEIGVDRTARVIDAKSGSELKRRSNVADPRDLAVGHDGRLYVADSEAGFRVRAYDLDTMAEPANIYTAPGKDRLAEQVVPCGKGRVCVLETVQRDLKTTELVAVDAEETGEIWRKGVPYARSVVPVGKHVLVLVGDETASVLFGPEGNQVLKRDGLAARLNSGNLLWFADDLNESVTDISVAGVRADKGSPKELGLLKGVRPASCSWNVTTVVCSGKSAFLIRRFAED